jgi:hypothetical protein
MGVVQYREGRKWYCKFCDVSFLSMSYAIQPEEPFGVILGLNSINDTAHK